MLVYLIFNMHADVIFSIVVVISKLQLSSADNTDSEKTTFVNANR